MAGTPNKILYPQGIDLAFAVATAAKTTYGDIANAVQFALPASGQNANGILLKKVRAYPRATVTATSCIVWLTKAADTNNLNPVPVSTALMKAFTMDQTAALPTTDFGLTVADPIRVGPGDKLWFSIGVALSAGIVAVAEYEPL